MSNKTKQENLYALDMDYFEGIFLANCLISKEFMASVVDHTETIFFHDKHLGRVFSILKSYFNDHNDLPSITELRARMGDPKDKQSYEAVADKIRTLNFDSQNTKELNQNAERFLKERMLYHTVLGVADTFSDPKQTPDVSGALEQLEKAYTITLSEDLGMFYFEDIDKHIEHLLTTYKPIPMGWEFFDSRTEGGLFPKTLTVFAGQVNVGKSIILGNIAANLVQQGQNVLLISLEMSEFMYAKRIDAKLTEIPHNELRLYPELIKEKVESLKNQINSQLVIKEYPPKSITVRHIHSLLTKLQRKGFKPDVVVVDYLNLIQPSVKGLNLYEGVKEVAEQLRALSFKWEVPFVTATQLNRCLEVNTPINMSTGETKSIKDLRRGDLIKGFDTETQTVQDVEVMWVHPEEEQDCWEIELEDGRTVICSEDHMFPTERGIKSLREGLTVGDCLTILQTN